MPKTTKATDPRSDCPIASDPQVRERHAAKTAEIAGEFPSGIAQPALRALVAANLTSLERLTTVSEAELAALHGIGPKAVRLLREALHARGLDFRD